MRLRSIVERGEVLDAVDINKSNCCSNHEKDVEEAKGSTSPKKMEMAGHPRKGREEGRNYLEFF